MNINKIKQMILQRAYSGEFENGVARVFNLHEFAERNKMGKELVFKAFEELRHADLIEEFASGGEIAPTEEGLLYCENNELVDINLIKHQTDIRTKLILTLNDIYEKSQNGEMTNWIEWIKEAGVNNQDFSNNEKILEKLGWIQTDQGQRDFSITSYGKEIANDLRIKCHLQESFEKLLRLEDITEQQRGHELENLLEIIAKNEKLNVSKRVRSQGQEIDLILNSGLHYFLCSCKWVKDPIQPCEVELLESRVRSRATTNGGILFSISGFTDNCIEEIRLKISSALIIPFGPADIDDIFHFKVSMLDLLDQKIGQMMNHRKILVDNVNK